MAFYYVYYVFYYVDEGKGMKKGSIPSISTWRRRKKRKNTSSERQFTNK
jgi:hypothetical protein